MPPLQKCPHCKIETPKPYDKFTKKYTSRKQCPNCGAQYIRTEPARGILVAYCGWCNHQFTRTELDRIASGDLKACPGCQTLIQKVKTVLVKDPEQVALPIEG